MSTRMFLLLTTMPLLASIVLWLLLRAWSGYREALKARGWPAIAGQVIASDVEQRRVRVRRSAALTRTRMALCYSPRVVYAYSVQGVHYQGARLHIGPGLSWSRPGPVQRQIARYPVGAPVTVYYNPANPAEATLDRRTGWSTTILALVGLLVLLLTLALLLFLLGDPSLSAPAFSWRSCLDCAPLLKVDSSLFLC